MLYFAELKSNLLHQTNLLKTFVTETQCVKLASFHISIFQNCQISEAIYRRGIYKRLIS